MIPNQAMVQSVRMDIIVRGVVRGLGCYRYKPYVVKEVLVQEQSIFRPLLISSQISHISAEK
jgi:hypothetical protein